MTSRKRNKGKERKAKNAKKEEEMVRAEAHKVWQWWTGKACSSSINNNCDHGRVLLQYQTIILCLISWIIFLYVGSGTLVFSRI